MATVALFSPYTDPNLSNTSFVLDHNSNNAMDESFASHLNLMKKSFMPELGKPDPGPSTVRISSGRKRATNGELDIFDAQKYFSGVMDHDVELVSQRASNLSFGRGSEASMKSKSKSVSGSNCSEASGNSQSGLLGDRRKYSPPKASKEGNGKRFLGVFRCSCSGKKAIGVDGDAADPTRLSDRQKVSYAGRNQVYWSGEEGGWQRREARPFVNSNLAGGKVAVGRETQGEEAMVGAPMRLFGPPKLGKVVDMGSSFRKSWTALAGGGGGGGGADDDDDEAKSEASSDLFEIDSLSINRHPLFQPEVMYEPSEASIEWSVVTASAANFSVASDNNDYVSPPRDHEANKSAMHRPPSLLFMGCASHKALNVQTPARISTSGAKVSC